MPASNRQDFAIYEEEEREFAEAAMWKRFRSPIVHLTHQEESSTEPEEMNTQLVLYAERLRPRIEMVES